MKKFIAVIFILIIGLLIITNPGMNDYVGWMKDKINDEVSDQGVLVAALTDVAVSQVDKITDRDNYWLFSVYTTNFAGSEFKAIGVARLFFTIKKGS